MSTAHINWGNEATKGLVFAANLKGQKISAYPAASVIEVSGVTARGTRYGLFTELDDDADFISFRNSAVPDFVTNGEDFTVLMIARKTQSLQNQRMLWRTEDSSNVDVWGFVQMGGAVLWSIRKSNTQTQIQQNDLSTTTPEVLVGTAAYAGSNAYTMEFWQNLDKSTNPGATALGAGDNDTFFVGKRRDASDDPWQGSCGLVAVWRGVLPDAIIQSLVRNPWQIFEQPRIPLTFRRKKHVLVNVGDNIQDEQP